MNITSRPAAPVPRKLTIEFLISRKACQEEVDMFIELFGEECELNKENLEKYVKTNRYAYKGMIWLSMYLLDTPNWVEWYKYMLGANKSDTNKYAMKIGEKLIEILSKDNI